MAQSQNIEHLSSVPLIPDTSPLLQLPLFASPPKNLSCDDRISVSYQRARAISKVYALTVEDVLNLRPKFWQIHQDLILCRDGAAATFIAIQYNLAAGTLAPFALQRPELQPLLQQIMDFDIAAQFMISEVGHGLDAPNLETTATLLPDGTFDLHTPHPQAAKWMPPTAPNGGLPRVGFVVARLIVRGEDHGVRPFIVSLGNGKEMCQGITSKVLPARTGAHPVGHAITFFDHVCLPKEALLGSLDKPADMRQNFLNVIWRVGVGSFALSTIAIVALRISAYVAGRYSLRRTVTGVNGQPMSIIKFRTQQLPILHALAQVAVLHAYAKDATVRFTDTSLDPRARHGIAASLKAVMVQHCQSSLASLSERCGAQGLFEYNHIIHSQMETRGLSIAEGDVLALCIRLASELLIGRYEMPQPENPDSPLAKHEAGLFNEARTIIISLGSSHRSDAFNRLILPLCQPLVEAIGHRMAYEAAVKAEVPQDLIDLYLAGVIKPDASWYVEHAGLTRRDIAEIEDKVATRLLPRLDVLLEETGAGPFVSSPIVSDEKWSAFLDNLPHFEGNAVMEVIPGTIQGVTRHTRSGAVHAKL